MSDPSVVYGDRPETILRLAPSRSARVTNHVLLGTWLEVVGSDSGWYQVKTGGRGPGGWVERGHVSEIPAFKAFFVDVGQGDGAIVEAPNGRMLIDGGPSSGYHHFLKHLYWHTIRREGSVHFDAVVMSHPDSDHFHGLTRVLKDPRFTFGTIYHNGLVRYKKGTPQAAEFDLGNLTPPRDGKLCLTDTYSTLSQIKRRIDTGSLMAKFKGFWNAALAAKNEGRL
jgi:hypothetical protein